MKLLKKNQVIIYVIVLMLMTAGYLNYTTNQQKQSIQTAIETETSDDTQLADIGDATLVSSQDTEEQNTTMEEETSVETTNAIISNDDYFVKSKLERDTMYSQMLETYEKVLNSTNSLETQKQVATQEIQKINETKNSIMICENLIQIKGFENNVIFVNGDSINIIIRADELKQEEIAQIQNVISREFKTDIENIHIATK